jgi:hypothetical protein
MAFQSFETVLKTIVWLLSATPAGAVKPPLMAMDMPSVREFIVPKAIGVCGKFVQVILFQVGLDTAKSLATLNSNVSDSIASTPAALLSPP